MPGSMGPRAVPFGSNTFNSLKPGDRIVIDRFGAMPSRKSQKAT